MTPLNIEPDIVQSLEQLIDQQNATESSDVGEPRVEIVRDRLQLENAARVITQAFVENQDKGWLAWLRPKDVERIRAGDHALGERRLVRIISYLLRAAAFSGGIVTIETARGADGRREVRGAGMRQLPMRVPSGEGLLHKYGLGAWHALRSYGLLRALAADRAQTDLRRATEAMRKAQGIPDRCLRSGMLCVPRRFEGLRIASRLSAPFQRLADRHGLHILLQSSNPDRNDDRVFKRFGFEHAGEYAYGASRFNAVGPYTITFMVRAPRLPSGASR